MKMNVEVGLFTKVQDYAFALDLKPSGSFKDSRVQEQIIEQVRDKLLANHFYEGCGNSSEIVRVTDNKIEINFSFCGQKVSEIKREGRVVDYAPQLRAEKMLKTIISIPTCEVK